MKNNKKIVFISCFDSYENRIGLIMNLLKEFGFETTYITSDFNHISKKVSYLNRLNTIQIKTLKYKKNFSLKRLFSHFQFSKKALKIVNKIKPDFLYVMVPPNSLAFFASIYKRKYNTKLIFDIYDMWPETFPIRMLKVLFIFPFYIWKQLRNKYLNYADTVVTECDLFKENLVNYVSNQKVITLYPFKESKFKNYLIPKNVDNEINICYLGSINNIIDIKTIVALLVGVNKSRKVKLHIIGEGENKDSFIESLKSANINFCYYGTIFDDYEKVKIFNACHLGLNIMKDSVFVGLTLKSIEYLSAGLPLINNIKGDTYDIIKKYKVGLNVSNDINNTIKTLIKLTTFELDKLRENIPKLNHDKFSINSFKDNILHIFDLDNGELN